MARPFSAQRHFDLIGRVERKFARIANSHPEGSEEANGFWKLNKACTSLVNYIKAGQYGQGVAYMKKQGEAFIVELPETFETLQNQQALKTAKSKNSKKAA